MSILIKGMEMPKDCNKCPMTVDGYCRIIGYPNGDALNKRYKPLWCPLVEIPPHGRLIDADRLGRWMCRHKNGKAKTCDRCEAYWNGNNINTNCSEVKLWALRLINDMPTIIEAEGRE